MIKAIINILIVIAVLIYVAGPTITWKPFTIKLETLMLPLGIILIAIGLILISEVHYQRGKEAGKNLVKEVVKEYFEEDILP